MKYNTDTAEKSIRNNAALKTDVLKDWANAMQEERTPIKREKEIKTATEKYFPIGEKQKTEFVIKSIIKYSRISPLPIKKRTL